MGQTSNVYAIAKIGDKWVMTMKEIKVTLGGCGG
jgi:sulfur-oxidizing protein SoxY